MNKVKMVSSRFWTENTKFHPYARKLLSTAQALDTPSLKQLMMTLQACRWYEELVEVAPNIKENDSISNSIKNREGTRNGKTPFNKLDPNYYSERVILYILQIEKLFLWE